MVDSCWRYTVAVGGWIGIGAEVVAKMGYGVTWVDFEERGTEFGAVGLLVRAVGARAVGIRSLQFSAISYQFFIYLLPSRDNNAECADSGSGRTRCLGDSGVWYSKCCVGGSVVMGNKHVIALSDLAFFTQKCKINVEYLHN